MTALAPRISFLDGGIIFDGVLPFWPMASHLLGSFSFLSLGQILSFLDDVAADPPSPAAVL